MAFRMSTASRLVRPLIAAGVRTIHGSSTRVAQQPASSAAEIKAKMRRYVIIASVSAGVLCILPAYFYVTSLAGTPLPPHAAHLVGTWQAVDHEGEQHVLRFNKFNMVAVETPDVRQRGPVTWLEDGFIAGPMPVLSFIGEEKKFSVTKWPATVTHALVVDGLEYTKVK